MKSILSIGATSFAVLMLTDPTLAHRMQHERKQVNNNELVEMSGMGSRMSSLSLNMLNKQQSEQNMMPGDDLMIQTDLAAKESSLSSSYTFNRVFSKVFQRSSDDASDTDILAFSSVNAGAAAEGDDESVFGSGGAIMDALVQKDPTFGVKKEAKTTTKKTAKVTAPSKAVKKIMAQKNEP